MGWLLTSGGDGWSFRWEGRRDCGDGGRGGGDRLTCPTRAVKLLMSFPSFPRVCLLRASMTSLSATRLVCGVCVEESVEWVLDGFGLEWLITSIGKEGR